MAKEERSKRGGGLFGLRKKKKKTPKNELEASMASTGSALYGSHMDPIDEEPTSKKKKKRRGRKKNQSSSENSKSKGGGGGGGLRFLSRMVAGRKRRKRDDDDQSGISFLENPNEDDAKNKNQIRNGYDPNLVGVDNTNNSSDDEALFGRNGRYMSNASSSAGASGFDDIMEEEEDRMSYGEPEPFQDATGTGDDDIDRGDLTQPIALVLLLVDPDTLRFELLQLEYDNPTDAKVSDVLEQIPNSVTEPAIRSLEFQALVDRQGGTFGPTLSLAKALAHRRKSKDILVGLSKGVTPEHCGRLARPILGDNKVIGMLEINGYEANGWTKDKEEESELKDTAKVTFAAKERQSQLKLLGMVGAGLFVLWLLYSIVTWYLAARRRSADLGDDEMDDPLAPITSLLENVTETVKAMANDLEFPQLTTSTSTSTEAEKTAAAAAAAVDDFTIEED